MNRTHGPGSRLGIMGGGQLGRMLALAARRMGYHVHVFAPASDTPAGQVADVEVNAGYGDETAVRNFARGVDAVTFEFENIPPETIVLVAEHCDVHPGAEILRITQNRLRERQFLSANGYPLAAWCEVRNHGELADAAERIGYPAVLKTASFGYDGKGQQKLLSAADLAGVDATSGYPRVLEAWVPFAMEVSVIIARGVDGAAVLYPVCENVHRNHVLDVTVVPARIPADVAGRALELARTIADLLGLIGVMAVEMFLLRDGTLLVNELAPRPHNSGHFSIDACVTSQFEQQLRAVCGLPLGSAELLRPCAMANILGDMWVGGEPRWRSAAAFGDVKIHLYGKTEALPGRKMGHLTAPGATPEEALEKVLAARAALAS